MALFLTSNDFRGVILSSITQCVTALKKGQLIAYPTEAVFGLGCDPDNQQAIAKLLAIKKREKAKGLILVAANLQQLEDYIDFKVLDNDIKKSVLATWPGAVTWIMPAGKKCTAWLTGDFDSIAVRVSAHPLVKELCLTFGKPVTSTSANLSGYEPCRLFDEIQKQFGSEIQVILEGKTGGDDRPTEIRDAQTGKILRQG